MQTFVIFQQNLGVGGSSKKEEIKAFPRSCAELLVEKQMT
jgi:hypothetical protein